MSSGAIEQQELVFAKGGGGATPVAPNLVACVEWLVVHATHASMQGALQFPPAGALGLHLFLAGPISLGAARKNRIRI